MFRRNVKLWGIVVRRKGLDMLAEDATLGTTITQNFRYALCETETIAEKVRKAWPLIPNKGKSRVVPVLITMREAPKASRVKGKSK